MDETIKTVVNDLLSGLRRSELDLHKLSVLADMLEETPTEAWIRPYTAPYWTERLRSLIERAECKFIQTDLRVASTLKVMQRYWRRNDRPN